MKVKKTRVKKCKWVFDGIRYETACGFLVRYDKVASQTKYCQFCGKKIEVKK